MRYSALLMTGALATAMIGCTTREAYNTPDTNKEWGLRAGVSRNPDEFDLRVPHCAW